MEMTESTNKLVNKDKALTAINKLHQTHSHFKKITSNLKDMLGVSFGYMRIFEENSYYSIQDDLDCLTKFVTHVKESSIFCERNVTNSFDGDVYNFTLWPNNPIGPAMKVYHEYGIWNGITVSKINKTDTELYWFTGGTTRSDWHKFFIRNKPLLARFIEYFDKHKKALYLDDIHIQQGMFKFKKGFDIAIPKSEYIQEELPEIKKLITSLELEPIQVNKFQKQSNLSKREVEVLANLCRGYTVKLIAEKFNLSTKTVESYLDRIKYKTGLHFKIDLIKFYEKHFY
jgi:DNA-binding CsgD family transcriptional regulator